MGERLLLVLLAGAVGLVIGLLSPTIFPALREAQQAQQEWLDPPTRTVPTVFTLAVVRPPAAQTAVPPTLTTPPAPPTATPEPPPPVRSFTIPLEGGGDMTVNATDEAAARNNVKSTGAVPAEP